MRRLNALPEDEARAALRACCGSARWTARMLSQRPFRDQADVFDSAARIWGEMERADVLEAMAGHPRIGGQGDRGTGGPERGIAAEWSAGEQAGVAEAADDVKAQLAQANRDYEAKFGHIYLVCATGRSAEEMLDLCRARLANDPATELAVAAAEQAKITTLRLEKLLALGDG